MLKMKEIKLEKESILGKLPALISVFGALIFSLSVVYDYGYFLVFGVTFSEIPTTLSDHLRSSLAWIPSAVFIVFGIFMLELFNRRVEGGMTEDEIIESSPIPKFTAYFRRSPVYLMFGIAFAAPVAFVLNLDVSLQSWQFCLIISWFLFHNFVFSNKRIMSLTSEAFYFLSRWIPAVLILFLFNGAISADNIKKGGGSNYTFEVGERKVEGVLIRVFEKHYLIWLEKDRKIQFISAGEVGSFYPITFKSDPNNKIESATQQ